MGKYIIIISSSNKNTNRFIIVRFCFMAQNYKFFNEMAMFLHSDLWEYHKNELYVCVFLHYLLW